MPASRYLAPAPTPPAPSRPVEPPRPAEPRERPPALRRDEAPRETNGNGNGRGGWLSDLLSRASQDEPAPEARPAPAPAPARPERARSLESLDSISVDIARMIDHEAAVELWDRYRRGERNVFSRRLYTLQGQQTFDEIRRKYRRDDEFKQTVDRYVEEFERLIAEVSREDRDGTLTRTYLISETGKVYTMLAHAAGRFE
jgi:hypothetical protein